MGKLKYLLALSLIIILTSTILFAPLYPVQSTITQTRNRNLRYEANSYNQSSSQIAVNVTNTDVIGGTFIVVLRLSEAKPAVGGVEFETKKSATSSQFIDAGATCNFSTPEAWRTLQANYTFFYSVTPPTVHEEYNVSSVEYKSLLSML